MQLRQPVSTVGFIDDYCLLYRALFSDVRAYECFKWLHVGIVSILPRKTLPAIGQLNGLKDGQSLHHYFAGWGLGCRTDAGDSSAFHPRTDWQPQD